MDMKSPVNLTPDEQKQLEQDQKLLAAVAALNAQNGSYESPLASLSSFKRITPLTYACIVGKMFMVKDAIQKGSDVNETDDEGITPLHAAAERGYTEIVQLLLELGADKNRPNKKGLFPADLAEKKGHHSIVTLLGSTKPKSRFQQLLHRLFG